MEEKEEFRMDFYHSWIYESILNAKWFIWSIVVIVLVSNFLGPLLVWFVVNSKAMPFKKKEKKEKSANQQG